MRRVVTPISARYLNEELCRLKFDYCVSVPDSCQATLLKRISEDNRIKLVTASSEDEAVAISAGLWMGGRKPFISIQNSGVFACMNALRGMLDMEIPVLIIAGLYRRDTEKFLIEHTSRAIKNFIPLIDSLDIPHHTLANSSLRLTLERWWELSEQGGPSILYIGTNLAD